VPGARGLYEGRDAAARAHRQRAALLRGDAGGAGRQKTAECEREYSARAGTEGTISRGVRVTGLRHARYRGLIKNQAQALPHGSRTQRAAARGVVGRGAARQDAPVTLPGFGTAGCLRHVMPN
jgi:IS5 family transposase